MFQFANRSVLCEPTIHEKAWELYFVRKALSGSASRTQQSWLVMVPVLLENSRTWINI